MSPLARSLLALAAVLAAAAMPARDEPDPDSPYCTDYYFGDMDASVSSFQFSILRHADVPADGIVLNFNIYKDCNVLNAGVSACNSIKGNSTRPHVESAGPGKYDVNVTCLNNSCPKGIDAIGFQGCK